MTVQEAIAAIDKVRMEIAMELEPSHHRRDALHALLSAMFALQAIEREARPQDKRKRRPPGSED